MNPRLDIKEHTVRVVQRTLRESLGVVVTAQQARQFYIDLVRDVLNDIRWGTGDGA